MEYVGRMEEGDLGSEEEQKENVGRKPGVRKR